jgi:hypothetical protein
MVVTLYYDSTGVTEHSRFGAGKLKNDFGQGF